MRKDVKAVIDELLTKKLVLNTPYGKKEYQAQYYNNIVEVFFTSIIEDKTVGLYWAPNLNTESGYYFFQHRNEYQKKIERIMNKLGSRTKKIPRFKKIRPIQIRKTIENTKKADLEIDKLWKEVLAKRKLKDIESDFS